MLGVFLVALPVGLFIGAVGIGGVVLPPVLMHLGGLDVHSAAGTSIWCFLFTGVVGTLAYARHRVMPWRFAGWLTLGTAPAALAGALANGLIAEPVLVLALAAVTAGSGAYHLYSRTSPVGTRTWLPAPQAVAVGAAVGFGSALTGTGGPVLLVPALLLLGVEPLLTVAASQLIQLPLVGFAVAGYAAGGSVQFGLGSVIGVLAAIGVVLGTYTARMLRPRILQTVVAVTLVLVGVSLLVGYFLARSG